MIVVVVMCYMINAFTYLFPWIIIMMLGLVITKVDFEGAEVTIVTDNNAKITLNSTNVC